MSSTKNHAAGAPRDTSDRQSENQSRSTTSGDAVEQLRDKAGDIKDNLQEMGELARGAAQKKVGEIRDTAQAAADQFRDTARETASQLRSAAQEKVGELRESAADYYNQGRDRAYELERTLEQRIREKPLKSMLVAAGIGVVFGAIWMRR